MESCIDVRVCNVPCTVYAPSCGIGTIYCIDDLALHRCRVNGPRASFFFFAIVATTSFFFLCPYTPNRIYNDTKFVRNFVERHFLYCYARRCAEKMYRVSGEEGRARMGVENVIGIIVQRLQCDIITRARVYTRLRSSLEINTHINIYVYNEEESKIYFFPFLATQ